jgi:N-acetylneuraminate synthase
MRTVRLGERTVGDGCPAYVIAEIGINHNGDLGVAMELIDAAANAGCNAVKFQKRTPHVCVPDDQRDFLRETPWGVMTYLDYRVRLEFDMPAYRDLIDHCHRRRMAWLASCWDEPSVDFIEGLDPIAYKVPSAALTNGPLLDRMRRTGRPIILSTGMSTLEEIDEAVARLGTDNLIITHATSTYPCPLAELNLRVIPMLAARYPCPIGFSGHETGLSTTLAAVCLGACLVERHITLDRAMWGTDQAASVEPGGFARLVKNIRDIEKALGDGVKVVYPSELPVRRKLRVVTDL